MLNVKQKPSRAKAEAFFGMRMPTATFNLLKIAAPQLNLSASKIALDGIQKHLAQMVADGRLAV